MKLRLPRKKKKNIRKQVAKSLMEGATIWMWGFTVNEFEVN